jgi:hypothetical protein
LTANGYILYATSGTHIFLQKNNVPSIHVSKDPTHEQYVIHMLQSWMIDFVINAPSTVSSEEMSVWYLLRRKAVDLSIPLLPNIKLANLLVQSLQHVWWIDGIEILHYDEF